MNIERKENPCKKCVYHSYDCHVKCFQFKEWRQTEDLYKEMVNKERFKSQNYNSYRFGKDAKYKHAKSRKSKS